MILQHLMIGRANDNRDKGYLAHYIYWLLSLFCPHTTAFVFNYIDDELPSIKLKHVAHLSRHNSKNISFEVIPIRDHYMLVVNKAMSRWQIKRHVKVAVNNAIGYCEWHNFMCFHPKSCISNAHLLKIKNVFCSSHVYACTHGYKILYAVRSHLWLLQ